ncbi:MAG: CofH family radical SAM protein [Spirochaetes bacterium]|nr:CofH family radical SAM protein [Spirochaetota bacterium]
MSDSASLLERIKDRRMRSIAESVVANSPISEGDLEYLLTTNNILELGAIANFVRHRLHGDKVYYGVNANINYTNICELRCPLCAYSKSKGEEGAFVLSLDEIERKVSDAVACGIDEVHIVGGLNPELPFEYYLEMLTRIKRIKSNLHIVAFTAVEYDYFSQKSGLPLEEIFDRFRKAGLNAIPGGGAEIFHERIRSQIAPRKITADRWLEVMRIAHRAGIKTNATMLYNHIEATADIIDHLCRIRNLQEETGGFKTFVPLVFHEENTKVPAKRRESTGFDDIRIFASARIFLYNVPHIKALWMYLGEKMAQVLLSFGVDEFGATYMNEKVVHAAGAKTPQSGTEARIVHLITNAGFVPVRVNASYEVIHALGVY